MSLMLLGRIVTLVAAGVLVWAVAMCVLEWMEHGDQDRP
jgi:hypothetical protein